MEQDQTLASLLEFTKTEMEYRKKLLDKYSMILTRSEGRIDNINHMVGDLIDMSRTCTERVSKEQDNVALLITQLGEKDNMIAQLENQLQTERDRYDALVEKYIINNSKINENNFNLK